MNVGKVVEMESHGGGVSKLSHSQGDKRGLSHPHPQVHLIC